VISGCWFAAVYNENYVANAIFWAGELCVCGMDGVCSKVFGEGCSCVGFCWAGFAVSGLRKLAIDERAGKIVMLLLGTQRDFQVGSFCIRISGARH
jgi:hypothetical protein